MARKTPIIIEELFEAVFSVRSDPILYSEEPKPTD
jgi:hypothetical protein